MEFFAKGLTFWISVCCASDATFDVTYLAAVVCGVVIEVFAPKQVNRFSAKPKAVFRGLVRHVSGHWSVVS